MESHNTVVRDLIRSEINATVLRIQHADSNSAVALITYDEKRITFVKFVPDGDNEIQILRILSSFFGKYNCVLLEDVHTFQDGPYRSALFFTFHRRTLASLIDSDQRIETQKLMEQLFKAISHCRYNNIIHRDIKPANILITAEGNLLLADFGLAIRCDGETLDEYCGTEGYMAPEIVLGHNYSFKVDIWSAGVVAYECMTKTQPFANIDQDKLAEIFKSWRTKRDEVLDLKNLPGRTLIMKSLRGSKRARPSALDMLKDKYFLGL